MSFEARYPGICAECELWFGAGEQIERVEWKMNGYIHAVCPEYKNVKPLGEVCPRCFLEKSVTGQCGCD